MHDLNLARARSTQTRSQSTAAMMLDQHLLVVIIALSAEAQAPKGVQVHRPERSGAGFARHSGCHHSLSFETCLALSLC